MKKEDENQSKEVCCSGACGCSITYIWLGVALICFIMAIAFYFGN